MEKLKEQTSQGKLEKTVASVSAANSIHAKSPFSIFKRLNFSFSGISTKEKVNFARHLSVTIKSGMPILEGLKLIRGQLSSKKFGRIIDQIGVDVNNGQSLAQSLNNFHNVFGDLFINMVKVGEASGRLSENLLYLSAELKKQEDINSQIKSAFVYPSVILVVTIALTIFLTTVIFPKILPIFSSLKITLPFTTVALIAILNYLNHYGLYTLFALIVLAGLGRFLISLRSVRYFFDKIILRLPVVGTLIVSLTLANFARSLSVLLKSGMEIVDALTITRGTIHNMAYQKCIDTLVGSVRRGETIAHYLKSEPKFFPSMFEGMIGVGEGTGNLENNLSYLAEYYTGEVESTIKNLTSLLEPILILIMGLVVGFIALSIITPIYSITQGLQTH